MSLLISALSGIRKLSWICAIRFRASFASAGAMEISSKYLLAEALRSAPTQHASFLGAGSPAL
jgi:hypothetical protein